jgi:hypothetical protein
MGFMDKAKKLAEQAQEKLDEAQKNFNQSGSPQSQPEGDAVRYDEHGRPVQDAPEPVPDPAAPATEPAEPPAPPPAAEGGGGQANASPDPFKPLGQ